MNNGLNSCCFVFIFPILIQQFGEDRIHAPGGQIDKSITRAKKVEVHRFLETIFYLNLIYFLGLRLSPCRKFNLFQLSQPGKVVLVLCMGTTVPRSKQKNSGSSASDVQQANIQGCQKKIWKTTFLV